MKVYFVNFIYNKNFNVYSYERWCAAKDSHDAFKLVLNASNVKECDVLKSTVLSKDDFIEKEEYFANKKED